MNDDSAYTAEGHLNPGAPVYDGSTPVLGHLNPGAPVYDGSTPVRRRTVLVQQLGGILKDGL